MKVNSKILIIAVLAASVITALVLIAFQKKEVANTEGIKWMSMNEAVAANNKVPKKLLVDIYTDWCGWCKTMDKQTYTDKRIIEYINKNYYAVKFNSEKKDETIVIKNRTYKYMPEYKCNELAVQLLRGQMSYPTTVFIDETFTVAEPVAGFLKPADLMPILKYFATDSYKDTTIKFDQFKANPANQ